MRDRATIRRVETLLDGPGGVGPGTALRDTVPDDATTGQPGVRRPLRMQFRHGAGARDEVPMGLCGARSPRVRGGR